MLNAIRKFMIGRYGIDKLCRALSAAAIIFMLAAMIIGSSWLTLIGYLLFALCIYRALSKNTVMRLRENRLYMTFINNAKAYFKRDRKYFRYLRCPKCRKTLKVPKNKGKISITCPHCKYDFIKKT